MSVHVEELGRAKVLIEADASELRKGLDSARGSVTTAVSAMSGAFTSLGTAMKEAFAPLAVIWVAIESGRKIIDFAADATHEYMAWESALRGLQAAVESQGGSWENLRGQVEAVAASIQETTRFDDAEVVNALTTITNMGNSYSDALKNIGLVTDFAAAKNMSLGEASEMLGRAMAGNIGRLAMYLPAIKNLSAEERDWAHVRELINDSFSGRAVQLASSYSDQVAILANQWADAKKKIGEAIIEATGPGIHDAINQLKALNEFLAPSPAVGTLAESFDLDTTLEQLRRVQAAIEAMRAQGFSEADIAKYRKLEEALQERKAVLEALARQTEAWRDRLADVEETLTSMTKTGWGNNIGESLKFGKLTQEAEDLRAKLEAVGDQVVHLEGITTSKIALPAATVPVAVPEQPTGVEGYDLTPRRIQDTKEYIEATNREIDALLAKSEREQAEHAWRIRQTWENLVFNPLVEGFRTAFQAIGDDSLNLKQKLSAIWTSIRDAFVRALEDMMARWLAFKMMTSIFGFTGGNASEVFGVDAGYGAGGVHLTSMPSQPGPIAFNPNITVSVGNTQVASVIRKQQNFNIRRGLTPAMA